MSLSAGYRLGPYEILAPIGAGGMGEVYKARDTRLHRTVAIKILPHDKLADADRKRRFLQEARAASALTHPNIVVLYDISNHKGMDFLVMEYVPGKTLKERIHAGALPASEVVRYGTQMASAVAAAHTAGIVHRDIKPANIMVTPESQIKVLEAAEKAGNYVSPLEFAMVHFALGDTTEGIARMKDAVNEHSFNIGFYISDPVFDPVREDPEFAALMNEMHFPPACWREVPRYRK
jgi:serine/threonine protein kinase